MTRDLNEPFESEKLQGNLTLVESARASLVINIPEPKCPNWQAITPPELRVAIGAIREEIEMSLGLYRMELREKCLNALHSFTPTPALLLPFFSGVNGPRTMEELTKYREQKIEPEEARTLSEIFKAYCDKYTHRVWELMRNAFTTILRIALTQQRLLIQTSAADWTHAHTAILVRAERRQLKALIKHMCDKQEQWDSSTDFEAYLFWRSWRAPLLVHMCPMGNTLYDHNHAWDREDRDKTEETLDALSRHILMGIVFGIERIVKKLHVEQAASVPVQPKSTPNGGKVATTALIAPPAIVKRNIFISYSQVDKEFTERLAMDLKNKGLGVWWDEWEIKVGDSIVKKVSQAIDGSAYLAVVLSPSSVKSQWVQVALGSALMRQLSESRSISILPLLVADCEIPALIRDLRWADFRHDYNSGLRSLLDVFVSKFDPEGMATAQNG